MGGGTRISNMRFLRVRTWMGLSPRGRGNPSAPLPYGTSGSLDTVYPRVGGGTAWTCTVRPCPSCSVVYPRVGGGTAARPRAQRRMAVSQVYPRVGGGTAIV